MRRATPIPNADKKKPPLPDLPAERFADHAWSATRLSAFDMKVLSYVDGASFFISRAAPGGFAPAHRHPYRQLRYVLEGEFIVNGTSFGPGSLIEFPEHVFYEVMCPNGGQWIVVQMPGKEGGVPPDPRIGEVALEEA